MPWQIIMPARPKELLCTCALCPSSGRFFQPYELAGHKARLAMQKLDEERSVQSFHVEKYGVYGASDVVGFDRHETLTEAYAGLTNVGFSRGTGHLTAQASSRDNFFDSLESLHEVSACLRRASITLQAIEFSTRAWTPAKSQTLQSIQNEVLGLRSMTNAALGDEQRIAELKHAIRSDCDRISDRILDIKRTVPNGDAKSHPREFDCGEYSVKMHVTDRLWKRLLIQRVTFLGRFGSRMR